MGDLISLLEHIPEQWRVPLVIMLLVVPRLIQYLKHIKLGNGDPFKFFGKLDNVLTKATQQRNQILGKLDTIQYDVALIRKFVKIKFGVTEEDMIKLIGAKPHLRKAEAEAEAEESIDDEQTD